jgi:membrane-associated protease RseP (regulator of RpoE activity)
MASPRHLWSGDWRQESDAAADELARRRGLGRDPAQPEPDPEPERAPSEPLPRVRPAAARTRPQPRPRTRTLPRLRPAHARLAVLVALGALLVGGAAYALSSLGGSSGNPNTATIPSSPGFAATSTGPAYLGVDVAMPIGGGVIVEKVVPGSAADRAGLEPGDVLMQIGNQPIMAPTDVSAALQGLHPGDRVDISVLRGASTFTTQATLTGRPARSP